MCVTLSLKIEAIQTISLLVFFKLVKALGLMENESLFKKRRKEREGDLS